MPKREPLLALLHIYCPNCERTEAYTRDDVIFYSNSNDCSLCGSHGDIRIDTDCNACKKPITVELHSW